MKNLKLKHIVVFASTALLMLALDRLIKKYAIDFFSTDFVLIKDFFKLSLHQNTGIAFSIGLPMFFQILIFPVLLGFGLFFVLKYLDYRKLFVLIVTGLIAGGAISNFIDRMSFGYVIDYISISIFPVFNIADIAITIGIFILIVFYGKIKRV